MNTLQDIENAHSSFPDSLPSWWAIFLEVERASQTSNGTPQFFGKEMVIPRRLLLETAKSQVVNSTEPSLQENKVFPVPATR
jgi:hypothetical protein